jgi:hypothetical protein
LLTKATQNFFKKRDALIDKGLISKEQYNNTRDTFKKDPKDKALRPHKISCKDSETLVSITIVPETQYRILVNIKNCSPKVAIFTWIGKHREYEKIIKNKRNCKSLFVPCEEVSESTAL